VPGTYEFDVLAAGNVAPVSAWVHNKGPVDANATLRFFWQVLAPDRIRDNAWQPVRDKAADDPSARDQVASLTVPSYGKAAATVSWFIGGDSRPLPPKGKGSQPSKYGRKIYRGAVKYALRVVVDCPADGTPSNNSATQVVTVFCRRVRYVPYPAQPGKRRPHRPPPKKRPKPGKTKHSQSRKKKTPQARKKKRAGR
jgi:hypothetical protein